MTTKTCDWYDVGCGLDWLSDELQNFFLWVYHKILSGFAYALESVPVPDFMATMGTISIPSEVAWFASAFQLDVGLSLIVASYSARFLLRRIPAIG